MEERVGTVERAEQKKEVEVEGDVRCVYVTTA